MPVTFIRDPRRYQIVVQISLLVFGIGWLELPIRAAGVATILGAALLTQLFWTRWKSLPGFDPRSPLISGLSLCLLLRTELLVLMAVAAFVTISSKFLLRSRGKHLFNPTTFGLVAMLLLTDRVWVSPGQWGSGVYFVLLLAGLGGLVVYRAERSDVTYAFLVSYGLLVLLRAAWLGDPLAIPLHHLRSGAFLVFAFFMISDPKTTPDSRAGRVLFAFVVAAIAMFVHFVLYRPNGFLWALVAAAPALPAIDRWLPGRRYRWRRERVARALTLDYGGSNDETIPTSRPVPRLSDLRPAR